MGRISRRDILKRAAAFGLSGTAIGALLAACGGAVSTATTAPTARPSAAASTAPAASAAASSAPASAAASGSGGGGGRLVIGTDLNDVLTFDPGTHYEIISSRIMG